jgi:hypothetical protein
LFSKKCLAVQPENRKSSTIFGNDVIGIAHRFNGEFLEMKPCLTKLDFTLALTPARSPGRGRTIRRLPVRISGFGLLSDFLS